MSICKFSVGKKKLKIRKTNDIAKTNFEQLKNCSFNTKNVLFMFVFVKI